MPDYPLYSHDVLLQNFRKVGQLDLALFINSLRLVMGDVVGGVAFGARDKH